MKYLQCLHSASKDGVSLVPAQLLLMRYDGACQDIGRWQWCESSATTRGSALSVYAAKDQVLLDEDGGDDDDESPAIEKAGRSCLTI